LIYLIIATNPASTSSASDTKASDNLPDPDVLGQEIVEDLEAALEQFPESSRDLTRRRCAHREKINR
jgi:hypothetical protein